MHLRNYLNLLFNSVSSQINLSIIYKHFSKKKHGMIFTLVQWTILKDDPLNCLSSTSNSIHESSSGMVDKNENDDLAFRECNLRFYRARGKFAAQESLSKKISNVCVSWELWGLCSQTAHEH